MVYRVLWAIVVVVIVAVILIVPFGCALSYALQYAYRQLRRWWASQNGNQANIPQPPPRRPSMSDLFAALAVGPPPYDVVCPHGRTDLPPTTTGLSAEELGQANIGYQGDEAQPVASGQPSPSRACASITVQPSSAAEGSLGPRRRRSASVGNAGDDSAFGDDPPSYGSWALASVWALATLRGNPWVRYPARGNRRGLQVDLSDTSPRCSDVASPTPDPEELPPPYEVAVAGGFEVLPCALESLSVVQFRRATSGAAEDEVVFGSRPAVPDAAAGGPISEP
ncbi:hypothetical protein lerEdw1_013342 [Lerista edwardsae]|nr:hypothetical protein lerEdw1_013342 [Lerista edwardsae]